MLGWVQRQGSSLSVGANTQKRPLSARTTPMPRRHRSGVNMWLCTGAVGREKPSVALKEIKSNEEPSSGGRPIQILLPSHIQHNHRIYSVSLHGTSLNTTH